MADDDCDEQMSAMGGPLSAITDLRTGHAQRPSAIGFPEMAASAALLLIYSHLAYFVFGHVFELLQPNYVYGVVYLAGFVLFLTSAAARRSLAGNTTVILVWFGLILLMVVQFLLFEISAEGLRLFIGRMHFLLTMISMFLILGACRRFEFVVTMLCLVVVASCAINVAEFFLGGAVMQWMSNVPGRAAGLFENSNDSAMFICIAVPVIAMGLSTRSRLLLYAVTFVGVYVTFSRGGLVDWAIAVAATELGLGYGRRGWATRATLLTMVVLAVALSLSFFSAELTKSVSAVLWPYLDANTSARMEFLSNDSSEQRMAVLQRGLEAFADAPIFGHGVGYTHSWEIPISVHNMIVLVLAELGLIGAVWYMLFLLSLARYGRPYGPLIVLLLLVTGMFSHNHFERPALAIAITFYLMAATKRAEGRIVRR